MGCRSNLISYLGLSENGDILIVKNHMFRHDQTTLMRFLHTSQHSDVLHCAESWNIHRSRDWNRAKTVTSNHADHEPGSDLDLLKLWPIPHVFHMGFQLTKAPGHGGSRPCAKLIKAQLSRSPGAVPCFNVANWLQIIHLHPFSCFFFPWKKPSQYTRYCRHGGLKKTQVSGRFQGDRHLISWPSAEFRCCFDHQHGWSNSWWNWLRKHDATASTLRPWCSLYPKKNWVFIHGLNSTSHLSKNRTSPMSEHDSSHSSHSGDPGLLDLYILWAPIYWRVIRGSAIREEWRMETTTTCQLQVSSGLLQL